MVETNDYEAVLSYLTPEEERELSMLLFPSASDYSPYATLGAAQFGEDFLMERYTDDIRRVMDSVRDNPITIVESANAVGKSQPIETPVLTPAGFVSIGSLKPGDFVVGVSGRATKVLATYPQGKQETFRVTFNDGTSTLCSEDHLWTIRTASGKYRNADWKTKTTKDLIGILTRFIHIPMCAPVEFEEKSLRVDPYVMGVLMGDGTLGQYVRFDSADDFIINEVARRIGDQANVVRYRKAGIHYGITTDPGKPNPILAACQDYDIIGSSALTKRIPNVYLYGSVEQRRLLLAGIMDTDGDIGKSNHSITVTTISEGMAQQIQWLVWSLGGTAKITTRYTKFTHRGEKKVGKLSYRLYIKLGFCPFMLPKKVERYKPQTEMTRQAHRVIRMIHYVGKMESVCIRVDADDGLYLTENFIVTHNSHGAARIAVWALVALHHLSPQIYTAAAPPIENLERILWGEIHNITRKNPALFADFIVPTGMSITSKKKPLSFLVGVTIPKAGSPAEREAAFSGKHAPYLLFIIDEGDAVPAEVYKGIESCISGGKGHLLIMYNPRSEGGYVAELKEAGAPVIRLSAFDHPNVTDGIDHFPGAVTRNKTIHRIQQWTVEAKYAEHMLGFGRFHVPKFLVGEVGINEFNRQPYDPLPSGERVIIKPDFAYMVLGLYPGVNAGTIYDVWTDRWNEYVAAIRSQQGSGEQFALLQKLTAEPPHVTRSIALGKLPRHPLLTEVLRGNVTPFADYIPGAGSVLWSMDDGYIGQIDPQTMTFTADSHPRVIGFYQLRDNGDIVRFDELYVVREPRAERQIEEAIKRGYPRPEYVTIGPGSSSLRGNLEEMGFYTQFCQVDVEESIKHLREWIAPDDRQHRRFLVHPRCIHFRHEMKMYRRDDKLRIIKAFDHGCFAAGTLVTTDVGDVPIEKVKVGQHVATRSGFKSVTASGLTQFAANTVTVALSDGRELVCTPDHPIFVKGVGFISADKLTEGDIIHDISDFISKSGEKPCRRLSRPLTKELSLGDTRNRRTGQTVYTIAPTEHTSLTGSNPYIVKYGATTLGIYQTAMKYITKTGTQITIRRTTLNVSPSRNITTRTVKNPRLLSNKPGKILIGSGISRRNGTEPMRGSDTTVGWPVGRGKSENTKSLRVPIVARSMFPERPIQGDRFIALTDAGLTPDDYPGLTTLSELVFSVDNRLGLTDTPRQPLAQVRVLRVTENQKREPVFNLTIDGQHEFFANGVLVHNCDEARYLAWTGRNGF